MLLLLTYTSLCHFLSFFFFFFNDTATTEIYTLSLHDALPIFDSVVHRIEGRDEVVGPGGVDELHHRPAGQGLALRDLHDGSAGGDDSPAQRIGQAFTDLEVDRRRTVR